MAEYNVELRQKGASAFVDIYYPKTIPANVVGLLDNGKITQSLLPDYVMGGMRFVGSVGTNSTLASLLTAANSFVTSNGGVLRGCYFVASSNITITVDASNVFASAEEGETGTQVVEAGDWIIYSSINTGVNQWGIINNTYRLATTTVAGLMSSTDKSKLDGIAANANNYTHPSYTQISVNATDNGINIIDAVSVDTSGHVTSVSTRNLSAATTSANGVMSSTDKTKLDGIATGANNYVHPAYTALTQTTTGVDVIQTVTTDSTGHLTALTKRTLPTATTSATGVMSAADKTKLDGIATGANNYSHPTQSSISLDLTDTETIDTITINTLGHVTAATKQAIRSATTTQTGLVELATTTGTSSGEVETGSSTSLVVTAQGAKNGSKYWSTIPTFIASDVYATNLASANSAAANYETGKLAFIRF